MPDKRSFNSAISETIRRERRRLDNTRKKYIKHKCDTTLKAAYYTALKEYRHNIKELQRTQYAHLTLGTKPHTLWRFINDLISRGKKLTMPSEMSFGDKRS